MTGELVDIFANRRQGVSQILDCVAQFIPEDMSHIYAGELGWLSPDQAKKQWTSVASRNWQATASFAARQVGHGLLVDIGSTTCDIIPLIDGQATPSAFSDLGRQTSGELLYTGAIRTPLIALANKAPFKGQQVNIAAELFATTADCWLILGKLDIDKIQDQSADGLPWNIENSCRRIARLLGTDADEHPMAHWLQLAQWFAEQQQALIIEACLQVLSQHPCLENTPIITAGIGRFIGHDCAASLGRPYKDFNALTSSKMVASNDHASAVAVALLAYQQLT
jgi:probable H4MPT-linked C1 transfer pathway protein